MKNRIPGNPGRYSAVVPSEEVEKLQSGQPFSITLTRNDNPVEEGTPYSKETVLPDTVAEELCPDNSNPTPADAFASLAKVKTDVGNKEDVFKIGLGPYFTDSYVDLNEGVQPKDGCTVYYTNANDFPEMLGKSITIRTYMYGNMAIDLTMLSDGMVTNSLANINGDPKSGIFEYTVYIPNDVDTEFGIWISFCENPYFDKPVIFEPNSTVWQEIKNLKNSAGGGGTGGGSVDNSVLYAHINNKNNPHGVTAKQIGAVTQAELEEALTSVGGGITEEELDSRLEEYATTSYVDGVTEQCVFYGDMEGVLTDHMEFITQSVIAALPIYDGEVVE